MITHHPETPKVARLLDKMEKDRSYNMEKYTSHRLFQPSVNPFTSNGTPKQEVNED